MMKYAHLFAELYNTPHMIHPGKAEVLESVLRGYALDNPPAIDAAVEYRRDEQAHAKPYELTNAGVAVIPVIGALRNRVSGMSALSGMAGYQRLSARLEQAAHDGDVKAIMLDTDSPGGGVAGLYQLTDKLREIGQMKPVWAHSNEAMFSAAYAIGVATHRIVGAKTSDVGSIGVIAMLAEQTGWDKKTGVKYHTVFAGARKNDFNPHESIKTEALERLQVEVDHMYGLFVAHVAEGRPMTEQAIRDTEAGTFNASDARDIGLLDDIMNFEDAVHELEAHAANGSRIVSISQHQAANTERGETTMSEKNTDATFTQTDIDAARQSGEKAGLAAGIKQGATQERERVTAILNHDNAEGRAAQAQTIATTTDLSAEQAGALLASMPVAQLDAVASGASQFGKVMRELNPDLGADAGESEGDDDAETINRMVKRNHAQHGAVQ